MFNTFVATQPTSLVNEVRHLITIDTNGILTELVGDGATWAPNPKTPPLDLSTIGIVEPSVPLDDSPNPDPALTSDGLRLIIPGLDATGRSALFYTDRTDIDGTFGMATMLGAPADLSEPYMTDDCARLYFSALDTVFYISQ